jgi:hypothetical protein
MSKIALTPNASGTGTLTVAAPNTNTDRTITLPDATGTMNISGLANEVPAGSVGSPSIYSTGDSNTGIFFPAADTVALTTGGSERMRIDGSGVVGIGTTSSLAYKLDIASSNTTAGIGYAVRIRADATAGASAIQFTDAAASAEYGLIACTSAGQIKLQSTTVLVSSLGGTGSRTVTAGATGILAAASDSRLKQEVPTASIAGLAEIMQLRPVAYKWLDDIEKRGDDAAVELGFFANEAKDIIPSAAPMGNDGYYGFYDRAVIAALVKAVQEQQQMIQALQADIAALKGV